MKQTLRNIFLLVALFAATANLSAQTYNGGTWYSLYDANEYYISVYGSKTFNVFTPTLGNLTFEAKRQTAGQGNLQLIPIVNGEDQSAIFSNKLNTSYASYSLTLSNENTTQLKFYAPTGVTLNKYFKNIKLPLKKHILIADGGYGKTSESKSFGNVTIGNTSAVQTVKLRSFLTTDNITITSNNPAFRVGSSSNQGAHVFNVGANACASSNGASGTPVSGGTLGDINLYDINIYFVPTSAGEQSGTITITDGTSTATISVSGTGLAKQTNFAWAIANTGQNTGEYLVEYAAKLYDIYTLTDLNGDDIKNILHDYITFTSDDPSVVAIENEQLIAKKTGVATITATFNEHQGWAAFAEPKTIKLTIKKHEPEFTWNASNTPYYYGTSIPNIFATSNPDCQYTIVSDNEHVAKVIDNTLHIYNVDETANITVTQAENYKWNGKTETYTITPANPNNHVTFTINSENYYNVFRYNNTGNLSWKNDGVLLGSPDVGSEATNFNDRYYDIVFTGIPDKLSFDYERSTDIATGCDWYVKESVDGVTWSEKNVWEIGNSNSGSVEVQLNPTTRYLRFCYSGNYGGYFRNVKVTELEKFEADPNPLDFGTRPVGEGEQLLPLNFSHANAGRITTATIIGKDAQYFTVMPTVIPGTGRDMSGTTHLNVTFANNGEDRGQTPYEATLVITDNAGRREEVPLTGVRYGKATPEFTWNPNNFPYYFNTSIANIVVSSNTDCPLTITSSNENIAKVENGRLYIYNQSGEVTFTVSQQENDSFEDHTETFTFTPKAKPDLTAPFQVTPEIYNQAITVGDNCSWDGDDHHVKLGNGALDDTKKTAILFFSGRPDKLTFTYATSYNLAVIEIGSFDNPKWEVEESTDGENWKSIWSVRTNSTSWANAEIQLSETTQYVRFSYDGNYAGYFKNINISELVGYKYLRAADGHYLSRGAKWGTQAVVDAFGVVSRISRYTEDNENIYTRFFFVDNEQYMFETETGDAQKLHEVFTDHGTADNTNHLWQINNNGGILTIQSANDVGVSHRGNYITAINGVLAFTTNEAEATKWQMEDYTEHPQYIADMLNRQAAAAALKDFGEDINTLEKVRNRLKVEDFETREITIQPLALGEQTGKSRTIEGMPHIYEQTITGLETGFYRLTVKALYRISNSEIAWKCYQEKGKESVLAYAYANDVQYPIQSVYASYHSSAIENTDDCRDGNYYSTTLSSADVAFDDANRYLNDVYVYVEADPGQTTGTLRYGIKCPSYVPGAWLAYSTITLTHFGRKEYVFVGNDSEEPADWQIAEHWETGTLPGEYHNVRIEADVNIYQPIEVYGISITEGKNVHITSTGGLTVGNGGVREAHDGCITIDNLPEGAGFLRIAPSAINKLTKQVTVNYATMAYNSGSPQDEVWQYVGAPGTGMQMNNADKTLIYHWNEQEGWVKNSGTSLEPFVGYALTQDQAQRGEFKIIATPIFENKKIDFTKTQEGMNGDNLFVNSYLSPIDVARIDPNTDYYGIEGTFYLFNSGSWKNWQDGDPNSVTVDKSPGQYFAITPGSAALIDANEDQTTIPPMQGAYVIAQTNDAWINLDYKKHVYDVTSSMNRPMRAPQENDEDFMRVRLQVNSDKSGADRMYVIQYGECTSGYDNGYDARNILVEGQANLYTHEKDGQMEISVSDNINETYIGFSAGSDSEYTLRFTSVVGELYLKDLETETIMAIMDGEEYTFYATPNTKNDRRFLLFDHKPEQSGGVSTDVENVYSTKAWIADNVVYVTNAPINAELVVYTMSGVVVTSLVTTTPYTTIDVANMPTGVYMLRLNDKVYKFVCK